MAGARTQRIIAIRGAGERRRRSSGMLSYSVHLARDRPTQPVMSSAPRLDRAPHSDDSSARSTISRLRTALRANLNCGVIVADRTSAGSGGRADGRLGRALDFDRGRGDIASHLGDREPDTPVVDSRTDAAAHGLKEADGSVAGRDHKHAGCGLPASAPHRYVEGISNKNHSAQARGACDDADFVLRIRAAFPRNS